MSSAFGVEFVVGAVLGAGFNKVFDSANKELKTIKKQVVDTKKKLDLSKSFLAQEKKVKALALAQKKGIGDTVKLTQTLNKERQELSKLGSELKNYIGDTKKARAENKKFAFDLKQLQKQQHKIGIKTGGSKLGKIGGLALSAKSMLGGIFGKAVEMADSIDGTAQEKMSTIGNVLAKTQFKYQIANFSQLGEGMKEAAAGASAAKLPFLQTAAIIGQLNNAGVQGSSAGTALNATLRSLTKASEELGFEVVRSADGSLDLIKTLEGLDDATSWMSTDEKADALQNMFGDEGKKGVIPLLNNIKNLKTGVKELQEASKTGLVEKA